MIALTRILVATNLGDASRAAITYGVALARTFGAQLTLLRVLRDEDFDLAVEAERAVEALVPDPAASVAPTPATILRVVARAQLGSLLEPQVERDTRAEYVLCRAGSGGPQDAIAAFAREQTVDLIIMGRRRTGRVDQMLAGSVTERLVRLAPCPVLVIHHPEHEFLVPDSPAASPTA